MAEYQDIPLYNACDLCSPEKNQDSFVIYVLEDLLREEIKIPDHPHRHTFYQILYIEQGKGVHKIDFEEHPFHNHTIFFLAPGQVHNLSFEDPKKVTGLLINFNHFLFEEFLATHNYLEQFPFFDGNSKNHIFKINENYHCIIEVLTRIRDNRIVQHKHYENLIRLYLLEFFYFLDNYIEENQSASKSNNQTRILNQFHSLINNHYTTEHHPKYYAERLSLTPNYLNTICKANLGKTAGDMIRERLILEAKRLLVNSDLSVSEIAYQLNFEDNSYFTKFFKNQAQITPIEFRKSLNK